MEARIIDGRRYLLVPADENVEVNGLGCGSPPRPAARRQKGVLIC